MSVKVYLQTTAHKCFLSSEKENILLLGEWCKLFEDKELYSKLNYNTLDYIWEDERKIDEGIKFCDEKYRIVLEKLVPILNNYCKINQDYIYYHTLLRQWLYTYIQVIYDRYSHIKLADKKYNIYTRTIANSKYQYINTPTTFLTNIIDSDEYNQQIYSQIIKFLNIKSTNIKCDIKNIKIKIEIQSTFKERLMRRISSIANKIFSSEKIYLVNSFKKLSLKQFFLLSLKSKFLLCFDTFKYDISVKPDVNKTARKVIFNVKIGDEFESLLFDSFIYNFPLIYLEAHNEFSHKINNLLLSDNVRAIHSSNAIHGNEIFKFFIAKNRKKLKVIYSQHGGNYGIDKSNIPERIERSICDNYYTFGWQEKNTKVVPLNTIDIKKSNPQQITFIMTALPRYFYRFVYQEDSTKMLTYIENSKTFLSQLKNINYLTIRMYMQDYKWNIKERLLEVNKNLKFDNTTSYYKQISNSKLVIFDHMHTGHLETLTSNIPTIIIIPKNIYYFRDSAKPYIQMLKDVKILFDDPIEASKFVDNIYDDIDKWWLSKEVQKVREEFCYNYARTSDNWADEWVKEFTKVLEE